MRLFGALSAGKKTNLLCRSKRYAPTLAIFIILQVSCLKFCISLEIHSSDLLFTISFQDKKNGHKTFSCLAHCDVLHDTIFLATFPATLGKIHCNVLQVAEGCYLELQLMVSKSPCSH